MLTLPGWTPVKVDFIDPRWQTVKDAQVVPPAGLGAVPQDVNKWVNQWVRYVPDKAGADYWQPPEETMKKGTGDCEDFALLKRALLIAGGWPKEGIAFVLVNDLIMHSGHAFIIVGHKVLDSRTNVMIDVDRALDYAPIRMFTEEGTVHFVRW
jgi:predicted transglutaminase-like cysteine proteinase